MRDWDVDKADPAGRTPLILASKNVCEGIIPVTCHIVASCNQKIHKSFPSPPRDCVSKLPTALVFHPQVSHHTPSILPGWLD